MRIIKVLFKILTFLIALEAALAIHEYGHLCEF